MSSDIAPNPIAPFRRPSISEIESLPDEQLVDMMNDVVRTTVRHFARNPEVDDVVRLALSEYLTSASFAVQFPTLDNKRMEFDLRTTTLEAVGKLLARCPVCNDVGAVQKGLPCPACKRDPFDTEPDDVHPIRGAS